MDNLPISRHPFFNGAKPLEFEDESFLSMTPKQKGHAFLSRWLENVRPFARYPVAIQRHTPEILFRHVRQFYVSYVAEGDWTAKDYVKALDQVLTSGKVVSSFTLEQAYRRLLNDPVRQDMMIDDREEEPDDGRLF